MWKAIMIYLIWSRIWKLHWKPRYIKSCSWLVYGILVDFIIVSVIHQKDFKLTLWYTRILVENNGIPCTCIYILNRLLGWKWDIIGSHYNFFTQFAHIVFILFSSCCKMYETIENIKLVIWYAWLMLLTAFYSDFMDFSHFFQFVFLGSNMFISKPVIFQSYQNIYL